MKTLRDLMTPPAHIQGRIEAIIVRGAPRDRARAIAHTTALAGIGLADDRLGQRGEAELSTRQVTLIQQEHLPLIADCERGRGARGLTHPSTVRRHRRRSHSLEPDAETRSGSMSSGASCDHAKYPGNKAIRASRA